MGSIVLSPCEAQKQVRFPVRPIEAHARPGREVLKELPGMILSDTPAEHAREGSNQAYIQLAKLQPHRPEVLHS